MALALSALIRALLFALWIQSIRLFPPKFTSGITYNCYHYLYHILFFIVIVVFYRRYFLSFLNHSPDYLYFITLIAVIIMIIVSIPTISLSLPLSNALITLIVYFIIFVTTNLIIPT